MLKKGLKAALGIISLLALVLSLSACGGAEQPTNQASNENQGSNEAKQQNEAKPQQTFKLTMNVSFGPPATEKEPKFSATEKFAELVKERTDGRVEIQVFYSNQLVPVNQTLDALVNGTIDLAAAGPYWGEALPTQDFPWLPYAFLGTDHMRHVLRETEIGTIFEKKLEEKGAKVLFYWPTGNQGILSKEPITKLEDMKGKTFRLGSGLWTSWYKELGAAPANIAGPEQYEALMRGTIDGAIYPYYTLETHKFHEVAKHITVPGILDPILCLNYISLKTWNKIPEDLQNIILEVGLELEKEAIEKSLKIDEDALEIAQQNGVTVHRLTRAEYQRFIDSAQIAWDEFAAKSEDTKKIAELLRKNQVEYLEQNPQAKLWADQWLAD